MQLCSPQLAAHFAFLTREQIKEEVLKKYAEFKKMPLPLMLTPSATYPAYGPGGKLLNLTYTPTQFDSLITNQKQEVARIEAQLLKAKQDLATLNKVRGPSLLLLTSLLSPPLPDAPAPAQGWVGSRGWVGARARVGGVSRLLFSSFLFLSSPLPPSLSLPFFSAFSHLLPSLPLSSLSRLSPLGLLSFPISG